MLDARSIATLGIGYGAGHVARIGLLARTESTPDFFPSGRLQPGRKSGLRRQARANVRLEIGCAIHASAGLSIGSAVAVDLHSGIDSTAGMRLGARAEIRQETTLQAEADVHDIVLEMLLLAD